MSLPVVEGAKEKLAGAWAYLRSIPPHVWLGLVIGAIALVLAYLAWKNRNAGLSPLSDITPGGDPSSSLSPIADTSNLIPQNPQAAYWNYQQAQTITPDKPAAGVLPKFNTQIGYDIHKASYDNAAIAALNAVYNRNEENGQQATIKAQQAAAAKARAVAQYAGAPAHGYDIHAASTRLAKVVPIFPPANVKTTGRHQDAGIF